MFVHIYIYNISWARYRYQSLTHGQFYNISQIDDKIKCSSITAIFENLLDSCLFWEAKNSAWGIPDMGRVHLWWCHHATDSLSALLALCEGNPPVIGGISSQTQSFDFTRCYIEQTVEQTAHSSVIFNAVTLMWYQHASWLHHQPEWRVIKSKGHL